MLIGIDFDNTIVSYDALFHREGIDMGLIEPETPKDKKSIRDRIRRNHDDIAWQRLQGRVYGPLMQQAELISGVIEFFKTCHENGVLFCIVSHKTEFANYDETRTSLREAARAWMRQKGFFAAEDYTLAEKDVFFESTRTDKIARITELGCTHFIDDLQEVLQDEKFDPGIHKILFSANEKSLPGLSVCNNWPAISRLIFDE